MAKRETSAKKAAAKGAKKPSAEPEEPRSEAGAERAEPALRRADYVFANVAAFLAGGCLMVMEIVASRVLAPSFGNTVFLWTSVIGLILGALTAGYYLGGVAADRWPRLSTLAWSLALSGLFVGLVPILATPITEAIAPGSGPVSGPILATACLFLAPGIVIGAASPIAVKLVALGGAEVGHASGRVSALGALGSILGTFAAGFFLIPIAGNQAILVSIALVLALLGIVGFALGKVSPAKPVIMLLVTLGACAISATTQAEADDGLLFDQQTFYHRVRVRDEPWGVRLLTLDTTNEGAMDLNGDRLPFEYTQYIEVVDLFLGSPTRAAFIGGGSFAMPKRFIDRHPGGSAVVYEIDPVVVEVGERFFRTGDYPTLSARTGDARQLLRDTDERFDLIFGDAYNGVRAIPTHLTTLEYYQLVRDRLKVGGVYMSNIISPVRGEHAGFFRSTARTLLEVFPELYVFGVGADLRESHNLILVCPVMPRGLRPREVRDLGRALGLEQLTDAIVDIEGVDLDRAPLLTDDHSPIETLVADQ